MKILILTHEIPSPSRSDVLTFYHFIKYISKFGNRVTLLSLTTSENDNKHIIDDLKKYCSIFTIEIKKNKYMHKQILKTIKNTLCISNLSLKIEGRTFPNLLDYHYHPRMHKKVNECLNVGEYDLIYSARTMANYVQNIPLPKVVQPFDATYEWNRQMYVTSKGMQKIIYYIMYKMAKTYEKNNYKKFSACLVVTQKDKDLICSLSQETNCIVIPNGVDIDFFKPQDVVEDYPSVVFVSDMSGKPTIDNILYFYKNIYPFIIQEIPNIKLYLVGRNPAKEIRDLESDSTVIVTGTVEDVRPYIAKSSVFIAPMIVGTGIKNKVLEAMAMGKAVVTTSIGADGINGVDGTDFMITDSPNDFAKITLKLLNDVEIRNVLGNNARNVIEKDYSWEKNAEALNILFNNLVTTDSYEK